MYKNSPWPVQYGTYSNIFKVLDSEGHVYKMWMKEREDLEMVVVRSIPYDSEKVHDSAF